jgi:uncharacterized protein YcbK (DUF882 family)
MSVCTVKPGVSRRELIQAAALLPAAIGVGPLQAQGASPSAGISDFWSRPRTVWLKRPSTGEQIRTTYWADGQLIAHEYERLSWFLRDPRMQARIARLASARRAVPQGWYPAVGMDLVLLDILYAVGGWLEAFDMGRPLIVTSAFRHPVTNAGIEGAVKDSQHTRGAASDIVIPDVPASRVSAFGVWLRAGGVGFYPSKGFTHVDGGRRRTWRG